MAFVGIRALSDVNTIGVRLVCSVGSVGDNLDVGDV